MPKSIISTKKIQNVKINDSEGFVKIVGIYFTKGLQRTGIYNWNRFKIEKQTQQLSRQRI